MVKPVSYDVQKYFEYNGYLRAVETVEIRARVKGYLDKVHFTEGVEVKLNEPLYTIDPRQYQANVAKSKADIAKAVADKANALAQTKFAEADYERYKTSGTSVSKSELDKAAATVDSNKALVEVADANKAAAEASLRNAELELGYTEIRSPIAGRISRTLVTPGNLVGQSDATLLTTIVSVDSLFVFFDAPEKDFVERRRAEQASLTPATDIPSLPIKIGVATEEGFPHDGAIDFRENKVDETTGTVTIRGVVKNALIPPGNVRGLYPGLYARVRVPDGLKKPQLTIPEESLMTGQEGRFVYVIGKDNTVKKQTVTVGANVWRAPEVGSVAPIGWMLNNPNPAQPNPAAPTGPQAPTKVPARSIIAIEKGLDASDQVIVNGLQKARPGAPVSPDLWELIPAPNLAK